MMHLTIREHDFLDESACAFFTTLSAVPFVIAMNRLIGVAFSIRLNFPRLAGEKYLIAVPFQRRG